MKRKTISIIVISLIAASLLLAAILVLTSNTIEISTSKITLEYEENMTLPDVYGKVSSLLGKSSGEEVLCELISDVDMKKIGKQEITYKAVFGKNVEKKEIELIIKDETAPSIKLEGDENFVMLEGTEFKEPGYSAFDTHDGDLTEKVTVTVNENEVIYEVRDAAGNVANAKRTITVKKSETKKTPSAKPEPPTFYIKLNGKEAVTIELGGQYVEEGAKAFDKKDGDITASIIRESNVDETRVGEYRVKYSVTNSKGELLEAIRNVYIYEKQADVSLLHPTDKIIYLTFDDGPSEHTAKLLQTLDKYNVKVTFFVTGSKPQYHYLLKEQAERGHTVAAHAYSHSYKSVYASEEAYFKDFDKINAVILNQTGSKTKLFRFPGGSSNTVSRFNPGIMTRLAALALEKGLRYTDWNVSSGDAGGTTLRSKVVSNVQKGVKKRNGKYAIVLQHDTKSYSVEAVDEIVAWGLVNGYTFLPMTAGSPVSHHKIAN